MFSSILLTRWSPQTLFYTGQYNNW